MMKRIMSYVLVFVMIVVLLPEKIIFASDLIYDTANMEDIGLPKSIELETEGSYEYITLDIENVDLFIENTNIAEIGGGFWTDPSGMTDFSIIPKAVGETILTVVTPDGYRYECVIKVVPKIAETISDDIILKARVLSNSERYHYYKNIYSSPAERLNNEQKKGYAIEYANTYLFVDDLLSVLSLNFETGEDLKASKYYEAVLTDILENDTNNVWDKAYASWNSVYKVYNNEIIKKITGQIVKLDNVKTLDFIKNNEEKKVIETIVDYSNEQGVLKDVEIKVDLLDKLSLSADLINDFFDAVNYMYAYSAVQQEKIDILRDLSENAIDRNLSAACINLIKDIKFAQKSTVEYFVSNFGKGAAYDLFEFSTGIISALVLGYITVDTAGVNPYIPGIKEALAIIKGGRFFSNTIINADDISKNVLTVSVYTSIENEIKIRATQAEINFDSNMTRENAILFIAYADFFKSALINSHDVYINYIDDVQKADSRLNITGNILRFISGDITGFLRGMHNEDTSYDNMIDTAERLKNTIVDDDFYYSYDVVEYISDIETTTPSDWAKEYINYAIEESLLPDYMQGNYQNNITRAEFCTLLTNLIERNKGATIQEIVQTAPYDPKIFRDSYYSYVYYMACLGIVNGVTEDEFNPLGEITREQAAVLLMRTADFLDINISAKDYQYEYVSSWAKDGVNFVVDKNIMSGTNNGFEPQNPYTKEQAVTSIVRFYKQFNVDSSSYIGNWTYGFAYDSKGNFASNKQVYGSMFYLSTPYIIISENGDFEYSVSWDYGIGKYTDDDGVIKVVYDELPDSGVSEFYYGKQTNPLNNNECEVIYYKLDDFSVYFIRDDNKNIENIIQEGDYKWHVKDSSNEVVGMCLVTNVTETTADIAVTHARSNGIEYHIGTVNLQNDGTYLTYGDISGTHTKLNTYEYTPVKYVFTVIDENTIQMDAYNSETGKDLERGVIFTKD